jgi:hypothetical protein
MAGSLPAMRPWLRWLLVGTLAMTAVALWWPVEPVGTALIRAQAIAAQPELAPRPAMGSKAEPNSNSTSVAAAALPERLPVAQFDKADFDPFAGVQAAPPPAPKPPPVAAAPPPAPPAPVVRQAPPQNYRYLGSLVDPSGQQWVYLARGDSAITVSAGTRLDEGYVVEAIDAQAVHLHYAPLDTHVAIIIPPVSDPARR